MLAIHNCAAIPVTAGGKVLGIITDRDITCRGVSSGNDAPTLPVSAFMTTPVIALRPDDDLQEAARLMEENRIHHLPVISEDGELVGIIAQSDLGKRLSDREFGELARHTSIPPANEPGGRQDLVKTVEMRRPDLA
jgi:signal-transduction protein with cAMP-binding, CBS, and nucleotidyltransferase domain